MRLLVLTFCLLLDACAAQLHGTLTQPITCYHCDIHARHFPGCLGEPVTCHPDEVCSISYGLGLPLIRCEKSNDCTRDVSHPMRNCSGGGVEVHPNQCELCCPTTACVQEINGLLLQEFPYQGVFCPGSCLETDIATCVQTATYCHEDQFCEVGINDQLKVQGHCKIKHDIQKCHDDQAHHPCVLTVGQPGHTAKCIWDCCQTTECLAGHFGAYMGTSTHSQTTLHIQTPAPTTAAPATPAPTTSALTTPIPITPAPTTTAALSSTTATADKPVTCFRCDGACKDNDDNVTCPDGFCSMTVGDDVSGGRTTKKGCSNREKCRMFWTEWDTDQNCHKILENTGTPSFQEVVCTFCCTGDYCNADLVRMNVFRGV